jgi:hypothetical protein
LLRHAEPRCEKRRARPQAGDLTHRPFTQSVHDAILTDN